VGRERPVPPAAPPGPDPFELLRALDPVPDEGALAPPPDGVVEEILSGRRRPTRGWLLAPSVAVLALVAVAARCASAPGP
jgi:hypothetical protein